VNESLIRFESIKIRPFRRFVLHIWYEIKDKRSRVFLEGEEARRLKSIIIDIDARIHQLQHIKSIAETLLLHSGNKEET
jgi:hypothetical protein